MKSSTKRILSIAFAFIFFLGTIVIYGNFIRAELDTVEEKRSLLVSKESLFETQKTAVGQVQNVISQFQNVGQLRETVSFAIPEDPSVTDALNQFYAIASENRVDFESFSVTQIPPEPTKQLLVSRLGVLKIETSVYGDYEGIKGFLESLETNVRVANVKTANISAFEEGGGLASGLFTLGLSVEMYYQEK